MILTKRLNYRIRRRHRGGDFAPKQKLMKPAPPPKPARSPDTYPLHEKEVESQEELHEEEVDTAFDTSEGEFDQLLIVLILVDMSSPLSETLPS